MFTSKADIFEDLSCLFDALQFFYRRRIENPILCILLYVKIRSSSWYNELLIPKAGFEYELELKQETTPACVRGLFATQSYKIVGNAYF